MASNLAASKKKPRHPSDEPWRLNLHRRTKPQMEEGLATARDLTELCRGRLVPPSEFKCDCGAIHTKSPGGTVVSVELRPVWPPYPWCSVNFRGVLDTGQSAQLRSFMLESEINALWPESPRAKAALRRPSQTSTNSRSSTRQTSQNKTNR
mgnify:CR=1 FL=1